MRVIKITASVTTLCLALSIAPRANATLTIVMDQIGPDPSWISNTFHASQDFELANNNFDVITIDDFTMPPGGPLQVMSVEGVIGEFNGAGWPEAVTGYRAEFYLSTASAVASLTGNAGTCTIAPANATLVVWGTGNDRRKVTLDVTGCNIMLAGGVQYWVGIIPIQNFAGNGQVGVASTQNPGAMPGGSNGFQANPGGGFGFQGGLQSLSPASNPAYRVAVAPEPTSLAMIGFAAAILLGARRTSSRAQG